MIKTRLLITLAAAALLAANPSAHANQPAATNAPIAWADLGAKATAQYSGNGLSVSTAADGAVRLRCTFQKLEGEVTREGLWLNSTVPGAVASRFRVVAERVGRDGAEWSAGIFAGVKIGQPTISPTRMSALQSVFGEASALPRAGQVEVVSPVARFTRPGLTEEYSVSVDGVRQDFIVAQPPEGAGQLRVALEVSGASVQSQADGARLVLAGSGRKIAYSRLRVTDATGRALPARMEAVTEEEVGGGLPARRRAGLAVLVDDADAVYPVRIDPTFSDANWVSLGGIPGADYGIETAAVDASGNLYIGGMFSVVGDVLANCVAKWDGSSWSALGQGVTGEDFHMVYALAVWGSDLYVGGVFTNAGGVAANSIAKWNGSSWSALGTGVSGGSYGDSYVYALAVSGTSLFVGGDFTSAGNYPSPANNIAVWTGTSWTIAGSGLNGPVYALAASASFLYVGGQFSTAGGDPAYNVARFASGHWSALGSGLGLNSRVWAMAVSGSDLYVGGDFTYATNAGPTAVSATRVAKWNGSSWSALGSGTSGSVRALAVSGSDLYAGGSFSRAGGNWVMAVAKWDGSAWSALGSGVDSGVSALVVSGGNLYAVGGFRTAGGRAALGGAKWDGSDWSALASGFNSAVLALAVSGSDLYVGGGFISTGGGEAYYVAKWSGGNWTPLAGGLNGYVTALALMGGNLYVGGDFTYATNAGASAVSVNNIAKWDGSSWSALGAGLLGHSSSPVVNALAVSGDVLYAGGSITNAGGSAATCVAKWNGTAWSPIGFFKIVSTESPVVYALAVSGSDLYVGGNFTGPWELGTYDVSKYNGSVWSKLGSGVSGNGVYALAVSGSDLYVGGDFQNASGTAASRVAKWNGTSWSALGSGLNNAAQAFAFLGSDIYVGGWFTTAGGNPAKYMARWDGSSWSAVGSGADDSVKALALAGTDLYAGGYFDVAGGKVCGSVAKLQRNPLVWTSGNATWDTATAAWQDYAGASTAYLNGDHVRFTDAASGTAPQITLNATMTPASVTNDSTKNFTVSGSGKISGGAWLAKAGSGTLTLATANDYTGATIISGGKLVVNGSLASGSAVTVAAGATLGGTGTAAGTVALSGILAPGNSVETMDTGAETWNGGASYTWEINDARGTTGTPAGGWDWMNITGDLTIAASSESRFTINLVTLQKSDGTAGTADNFDNGHCYAWPIATVSGSVSGFIVDKFTVNTAGFQNTWIGSGTFSISNYNKSIYVVYVPTCVAPSMATSHRDGLNMHVAFTNSYPGGAGLQYVRALKIENCTVTCTAFSIKGETLATDPSPLTVTTAADKTYLPPGTTGVELIAVKPAGLVASVNLQAGNFCGQDGKTDPTIFELVVGQGGVVEKRIEGIPKAERFLQVFNGRPGLQSLAVSANGHTLPLGPLVDGGCLVADLDAILADGDSNTLVFTGRGGEGAKAVIMLADAPASVVPAVPVLTVASLPGGVDLSWLGAAGQWQLQACAALDAAWENVPTAPTVQDGRNRVVESLGAGGRFFRLQSVNVNAARVPGTASSASLSGAVSQPELNKTYGNITW